jgi:hypothetical protein
MPYLTIYLPLPCLIQCLFTFLKSFLILSKLISYGLAFAIFSRRVNVATGGNETIHLSALVGTFQIARGLASNVPAH